MTLVQKAWHAAFQWPSATTFVAFAGTLLATILIEVVVVGWKSSSLRAAARNWRSFQNDAFSYLLVTSGLATKIGAVLLFGITFLARFGLTGDGQFAIATLGIQPVVLGVVAFILVDFLGYWFHRFCHHLPFLWAIHRYHHSAEEMTIISVSRMHPVEVSLRGMFIATPLILIGMPETASISFVIPLSLHGLLKHSNIRSDWGWLGRYVLQSPGDHRTHHSPAPEHYNSNFASVFQIWDVVFGTAHKGKPAERVGLTDESGRTEPLTYFTLTYIRFLRRGVADVVRTAARLKSLAMRDGANGSLKIR